MSRHSAYGRQNASSNRVQAISGFAASIINIFYVFTLQHCEYVSEDFRQQLFPHPHSCRCENVRISFTDFCTSSVLHTHFCSRLHKNSRTLTWVQTKMCSRTHSLLDRYPNVKYFAIANGKECLVIEDTKMTYKILLE